MVEMSADEFDRARSASQWEGIPAERLSADRSQWDVVIAPRGSLVALDLKSIWRYRDLIWMLFKRDFVAFYKQTILGPLWYLIQPSVTALTFFVIFTKIAGISTDGLPPFLFYMSGIVIWTYFANSLTNNADIFAKSQSLFSKVYFPRLVVPISSAMSGGVAFAIQFGLLLVVATIFFFQGVGPPVNWLALPLVLLLALYVAALGMGVGLIVSALTVRFRDLVFATGFATQLWMYASPVVYPYSQVPEKFRWFYHINPVTAPIELIRSIMFGTAGVPPSVALANLAVTAGLLLAGLILFTRAETTAMDTV